MSELSERLRNVNVLFLRDSPTVTESADRIECLEAKLAAAERDGPRLEYVLRHSLHKTNAFSIGPCSWQSDTLDEARDLIDVGMRAGPSTVIACTGGLDTIRAALALAATDAGQDGEGKS